MSSLINITDNSNARVNISQHCGDQKESVIIWTCFIIASFVFGFPGAVVVLLDMFQKGRKGIPFTPNDVFMLNLTLMDGLFLLTLQSELYIEPNLVYIHFICFLYSFSLCGRPLFLTCICLDCYLAVLHPVTYRARKSLTPRVLMAAGVWTVTVAYGCYFALVQSTNFDLNAISFLILTLSVIGFCDISILWTLKRSSPGGRNIHPQKKRALQIIINNFVITLISFLPPIISCLVAKLLRLDEYTMNCIVLIPVMCITVVGNTVSIILHLTNLGKLDWLTCWKQK